MSDIKKVEQVSEQTLNAIKRKSALALPNNPSDHGMKAADIKNGFVAFVTDANNSVIDEVNRVVNEVNEGLEEVDKVVDNTTKLANANGGFAVGQTAAATTGFAGGKEAQETGKGGAVGQEASATAGFAGGYEAKETMNGGAVGAQAEAKGGFAGGNGAKEQGNGGAVGFMAEARDGFAGGSSAKALANGSVQLGAGTNNTANTLQFKGYKIVDAAGLLYENNRKLADIYVGKSQHNDDLGTKQDKTDKALATENKNIVNAINELLTAINALREMIINEKHFRGFYQSSSDLPTEGVDKHDFAYIADDNSIWIYGENGWSDSNKDIPDNATKVSVGTTITGAPGTQAKVVNSGTESNAVFDFTIPRGDQGESQLVCSDVKLIIGGEIAIGTAVENSLVFFNRTPVVGDKFIIMVYTTTSDVTPTVTGSYLCWAQVQSVGESSASSTIIKWQTVMGTEGPQGPQGPQGEPGAFSIVRVVVYEGVINKNGQYYIDITNSSSGFVLNKVGGGKTNYVGIPVEGLSYSCFVVDSSEITYNAEYTVNSIANEGVEGEQLRGNMRVYERITGQQGPQGEGVPSGGTVGQFLQKTPEGTAWANVSGAGAEWEKVRFTDETPTTTIETSSGVKQIKIRVSGEDVPNDSPDDCVVLSEDILLYLSPDGTFAEDTMKALALSVYNGAASMAYAHGFEYFTNDVVTYDCSSMGMVTSEFTGRQFVLTDISGATYPDGLSIASLPDGAAAQAMYAVKGMRKTN